MSKGLDRLTRLADAAFRKAMEDVIRQAKFTGNPLVVWKDGRIQHISAEEAERDMKRKRKLN